MKRSSGFLERNFTVGFSLSQSFLIGILKSSRSFSFPDRIVRGQALLFAIGAGPPRLATPTESHLADIANLFATSEFRVRHSYRGCSSAYPDCMGHVIAASSSLPHTEAILQRAVDLIGWPITPFPTIDAVALI
ncbi:hypothetical protein [Mesorhizobium sp. M0220]|uniref:hypothetical protein n=1 Tax=Mesorhizobium sp. M0220 TaxID=2956920 RepID=UPI003334CFC8